MENLANRKKISSGDGLVVLSLFDGISVGRLALERAGFKVAKYFASEIKDIGIQVALDNYPDTIEIGDVNEIFYSDGVLHTQNGNFKTHIDMVIGGSPCNSFSIAMNTKGRIGLDDDMRSGLFKQYYRILKEVNPKYFFLENVKSMRKADKDYLTSLMGVEPVMIDSKLVAPAQRQRLYWTNINDGNIPQPEKVDIKLQDVLDSGWTDREKGHCLMVVDCRPLTTPVKMFHRYYYKGFNNLIFKSKEHYEACCKYYDKHYRGLPAKQIPVGETDVFDGVRFLNQHELERCQTLPEGYTKVLDRNGAADVCGDSWTVDVIAHIFSFMKER